MSSVPHLDQPVFNVPVRWALRVLAWLAFGTAAYLAWHAVTEASIAGCGVGDQNGCDAVMSSAWATWLGMPVALAGLACYAVLAGLSVLLGLRNPQAGRWINTLFVMLAVVAAGASLWFLAIQVVAIGEFCRFCIVTDICGIAIGAVAVWSTARWLYDTRYIRRACSAATGLMALRTATALPAGGCSARTAVASDLPTPSLPVALGGAVAIVALLVGGQILFPAKTYELQQVALNEAIDMNDANGNAPGEPQPFGADSHIAMRIPAESENNGGEAAADGTAASGVIGAEYREPADDAMNNLPGEGLNESTDAAEHDSRADESSAEPPTELSPSVADQPRERIVKLLRGKLTLDVYQHPHLGSPEAPHVVVEMISYNCKHCRDMHRLMKQAQSRYGDQVCVVVMVIPFERSCNRLITSGAASHPGACATSRMVLGVARLNPIAFSRFHDWLMADKEKPPAVESVVARAFTLVDRDRLRQLTGGDELNKQIEQYVNLFANVRSQNAGKKDFGLPVQILGDHVMSGTVEKPADLYRAWEEHLGVKPR